MAEAIRTKPLPETIAGSSVASIAAVPEATRIVLRAGSDAIEALSGALDLEIPVKPKTSSSKNGRSAMWIGPDEWLIIDQHKADLMALCGQVNALHSAVDVSHRNTGIVVIGPAAASVINSACPHDLREQSFPVGACARTVLGKIEIVLYRPSEETYHVECWRSFAPYAFGILAEGAAG